MESNAASAAEQGCDWTARASACGLLALSLLTGGCTSGPKEAPAQGPPSAPSNESGAEQAPKVEDAGRARAQELSDCKSEVIALPPDFAPTLPAGGEVLWFAPGMFEAEAPGYFRYAFRLDFERPLSTSKAALEALLLLYYEGLMGAVAKDKKRTHPAGATKVSVVASDLSKHLQDCDEVGCVPSGQFFEASIETIDEFTTHKALRLKLLISATPSSLVASVLPEGRWRGESIVFGKGQGPAEKHLLPLGCTRSVPADAP